MTKEITGKAKGGVARAEALSPEQRQLIAKKAAVARWGEKPLQATHKGNFQKDFGIDVECYVLDDMQKTAVISQRGMGLALGLGDGGSRLPTFVKGKRIAPHLGHELTQKLENPIIFQGQTVGTGIQPNAIHGYDVTILIDLCKAIIKASSEGRLLPSQEHIAEQAHVIIGACAKSGITRLVYSLAGYEPSREEVIQAFKLYVREEAREYEKEFPQQLYQEWYRLYGLKKPERNNPWKFKHLTVSHVYWPLAKSNGKILELTQAHRAESNDRRKHLHQFLSDIGVKALRQHLGQLLGISQVSKDQAEYERHINRIFGGQYELDI